MDEQLKTILNESAAMVKNDSGLEVDITYFESAEKFQAAVTGEKLDFAFTPRLSLITDGETPKTYKPFVGIVSFDQLHGDLCYYVKKESPLNTLEELKGHSLKTYEGSPYYFLMRDQLGADPLTYFSSLTFEPNGPALMFALQFGKADAVLVSSYTINYMEISTPAPVRGAKRLGCTKLPLPFGPALIHDRVDRKRIAPFTDMFPVAHKDERFKKYHPLMKLAGFKFQSVTWKDFAGLLALVEQGKKSGWDKDYTRWAAAQAKAGAEKK
jgi:ABC-type phosphate/phosphonate transport system substrate-binding protein